MSNRYRESGSSQKDYHRVTLEDEQMSRKRRKVYSPERQFSCRTSHRHSEVQSSSRRHSPYRTDRSCNIKSVGERSQDLRSTKESLRHGNQESSTRLYRDQKIREQPKRHSSFSFSRSSQSPHVNGRRKSNPRSSKTMERKSYDQYSDTVDCEAVSLSSSSSTSSNDEKAIRMKLLKDKYESAPKRLDSGHSLHARQNSSHLVGNKSDNSKSKNRHLPKISTRSEKDSNYEIIKKSNILQKSDDIYDYDGTLSNGEMKHEASKQKSRKALTVIKDNGLDYDPFLLQKRYDEYKRKKDKNLDSSTGSSSSSPSSTSSSSSSEKSPPAEVKRSRWNSGSSNDSSSKISESVTQSKPVGPPLADPEILQKIKPPSRDSLIRQRNCKFCALFLKTKDDVDRHTLTHRHRVVTGEYFIDREYLLGPPYLGDKIQCTICNAPLEAGTSIDRHESSSQHRQQLHRWMARQQPRPPIKYYIEPI